MQFAHYDIIIVNIARNTHVVKSSNKVSHYDPCLTCINIKIRTKII